MKKTFYISAMALILTLSAYSVSFAQDFMNPIQANIDSIRQAQDSVQLKSQEQKQQMESAVASGTQVNITDASATEIRNDIERKIGRPLDAGRLEVAAGFENALKKLDNLIGRIGSRMEKMQMAGANISSSSALFDIAKANVMIVSNDVTDLENMLSQQTSTSTRKAILSRIRIESDKTKISVETAYKSIMDLIDSLKTASATSSEE